MNPVRKKEYKKITNAFFRPDEDLNERIKEDAAENFEGNYSMAVRVRMKQFYEINDGLIRTGPKDVA